MKLSLAKKRLGLVLGAVLLSLPVSAGAAPILHGPDEVLERDCVWEAGKLYFAPATGGRWELIPSTSDAEVLNPGDGEFHPMSLATVAEALAAIAYPLAGLDYHVYVLPYPRRSQLESATADGILYLAPGTRPYADAVVHAVVTHEVGHLVHRAYLPDADGAGWESYASLRGIAGDARYSGTALHAFRPHEVFAEDFRALFGSSLARESGSLENAELVWPTEVRGLEEFLLSLRGRVAPTSPLVAWPNPFRTLVRLSVNVPQSVSPVSLARTSMDGEEPAPSSFAAPTGEWALAIYDARGRLVRRTSVPPGTGSRASLSWDGRDTGGQPVPHGAYFARLVPPQGQASAAGTTIKLVLLP